MGPLGHRGFALTAVALGVVLVGLQVLPLDLATRAWISDTLQIALAALATASLLRAVLASSGVARAFWLLLCATCFTWLVGQVLWTLAGATIINRREILVPWDFFFLGYTAPLLVALMLRPDRRRTWSLGLGYDLGILAILVVHAFVYVGLGHAFFRDVDSYVTFAGAIVTARGLLLPPLAWLLLRGAEAPWRRTYHQLVAVLIVWCTGDAVSSAYLRSGTYGPGLFDLPWTVPFAWLTLLARSGPRLTPAAPTELAPDWRATRRGTAIAVLATTAICFAHLLQIMAGSDPPALVRRRSALTFLTLLVVVALLLTRQLQLLSRIEAAAQDEIETRMRLQRTERMSAVGLMVAGVAHEINNPLTAILGHAELLKRRPLEPPDPGRLEQIREAAERCARIVKSLLIFARDTNSERRELDLGDLVRGVLELEANTLRGRGVRPSAELQPAVVVTGNAGQLQQVLVNLVTNALAALAERPGAGRLRLAVRAEGARAVAEVEDDGPGVAPEARERIFEPLFTTRGTGEGTGLGLAISRDIVKEHGGTLTARDGAWGGALFRLELPRFAGAEAPPPAPREPAPPVADLAGVRILVVDDEPSLRSLIAQVLEDAGAEVLTAADGDEGLRALDGQPVLVVSDVRMPGDGGAAFYERALARSPALRGRFVFVTGDTASRETWEFLSESGCPTLQKPFSPDTLLEAVVHTAGRAGRPPR